MQEPCISLKQRAINLHCFIFIFLMKGEITTDILLKEMITIDLIKAVVVVTGSSSGIGRAVAVKYLQEGYVVCGLDNNVSNNKNHIDEYLCDVSNEEEVKIVFTKIQQKYGSVKYLINCAGIFFATSRTSIETMILSEWDRVIKNNLNSYIIVTKYAISAFCRLLKVVLLTLARGGRRELSGPGDCNNRTRNCRRIESWIFI